jgi:hemerythrin-like metal-binding protein
VSGLAWDESMETGDALVDQQHRNIHALVDQVEAADDDLAVLRDVLDQLMEHVDCHFATEEALMVRTGYVGKDADEHIAEHRRFTSDARDAVLEFRTGELTHTQPVVEFLRIWLADHVHDRDIAFIEHVRSQGATACLPEPWASHPLQLDDRVA